MRPHHWVYEDKYYPVFSMMSQIFYFRNSISDILFQTWGHTIECMKTNTTQYFLWCHRFSISEILFQIFYFRHEATPLSVWRQILPSILYDVTDFLFQKFYFRYFISDMRPHHWVYEDKYYPVFSMMSQIFYFRNSISDILFQTWGHTIECMKTNTIQYFLWCHRFSISEILFQIFYFRHEATPLSVWRQILPSIFYDVMSTDFLFQNFYFRHFISDMRPHHWVYEDKYYPVFSMISDILFQTWGHTIECMKTNTTQYFLWCHVHRFSISEILFQIFYFRHEATPLSVWRQILPSIYMMSQIFYFRNSISDILFQTWGHTIECMRTNTTQYFLWCHRFSISEIPFQIFFFRHEATPLSVWRQILPSISMMSCPQIFYFRNSVSDILFQTWGHTIECMKTNTTQYFLWCHRFSISEILFQIFYFRHEATPLSVWRQILPSIFYDVTDFLFQKFYFRYSISDMRPHHWVYEDKYYPVFSMMSQIFYFRNSSSDISYFIFSIWGYTIECYEDKYYPVFLWCQFHIDLISVQIFDFHIRIHLESVV